MDDTSTRRGDENWGLPMKTPIFTRKIPFFYLSVSGNLFVFQAEMPLASGEGVHLRKSGGSS